MRDYYEILGVGRDADADAIKKAYRKLALQYHPDRNQGSPDAEEKFKEATEAYEVLREPEKRAAYDRFGHAGVRGGASGGGSYGGFDFSDALEIFMRDFGGAFGIDDLFGGGARRRGGRTRRRGPDLRVQLPLTLQDVAEGTRKTLRVRALESCAKCGGTGGEGGSEPVACAACGGTGEVRRVQRSFLGQVMSVAPCPTCAGEGVRVEKACGACGGEGLERGERLVEVEVPPGVSTGDYITLRGQGNAGPRGGPQGDIIVMLDVQEDPRFVRDGADLVHELPITFSQAALGAEVEVPTVTTPARLSIPAGIQSGQLLRLRGRGLPRLRGGGQGDLIVRVLVWTPTSLTPEQEELLQRLAEVERSAPAAGEADTEPGFWTKVRGAFGA